MRKRPRAMVKEKKKRSDCYKDGSKDPINEKRSEMVIQRTRRAVRVYILSL